jgi:hypothetical protein
VAASALDDRALRVLSEVAERLDVRARAVRCLREIAVVLAAVLVLGAGAATAEPAADQAPVAAVPAAATESSPRQARAATESAQETSSVRISALPAPVAELTPLSAAAAKRAAARETAERDDPAAARSRRPAAAAPDAAAPDRWLPTGTGMWLHEWKQTQKGNAASVAARAQRSGFSHLYVQTGSSKKGWIGEEVLSQLMPALAGTDIAVIAWDFPKLDDPEEDARRMARAARWSRPGAPRVMAVAPDVETGAEGTDLSGDRVVRYYRELRRLLPDSMAILATVPWPSEMRTGSYPYATTAPYADAFIPMAYWYNRPSDVVTATSMTWLKRFGKPVMPVGQGYDGRLDVPWLKADPDLPGSIAAFISTARKHGAQSLSLWSWQTTGGAEWTELVKAAGTVGPKPAPKPQEQSAPAPRRRGLGRLLEGIGRGASQRGPRPEDAGADATKDADKGDAGNGDAGNGDPGKGDGGKGPQGAGASADGKPAGQGR